MEGNANISLTVDMEDVEEEDEDDVPLFNRYGSQIATSSSQPSTLIANQPIPAPTNRLVSSHSGQF